MRSVMGFALVALVAATAVPRFYGTTNGSAPTARPAAPAPVRAREAAVAAGSSHSMILQRRDDGQFHVAVDVEGRRIDFLVDTGASSIALRESDAAWIGINPKQRDYTVRIGTANGIVFGAPVRLRRVELGSLTASNVPAVVLPDTALGQNLLGMSFLQHVRWEYRDGRLVLDQ